MSAHASHVQPADVGAGAPVVVGVDGSSNSKAALAWAARYAATSRLPLRVIAVWHAPTSYGWTVPLPVNWDPEADTKHFLDTEVKEVLGSELPSGVTLSVLEGPPGRVLTEASQHASAVVVGTRGRGQVTGMLLGSVSEFVTTHAHCPVVVVRDPNGD